MQEGIRDAMPSLGREAFLPVTVHAHSRSETVTDTGITVPAGSPGDILTLYLIPFLHSLAIQK